MAGAEIEYRVGRSGIEQLYCRLIVPKGLSLQTRATIQPIRP